MSFAMVVTRGYPERFTYTVDEWAGAAARLGTQASHAAYLGPMQWSVG